MASGTPGVALNTSAVRQQIHTCGANDQGQLGLGGTFTEEVTPARMLNKPATVSSDLVFLDARSCTFLYMHLRSPFAVHGNDR